MNASDAEPKVTSTSTNCAIPSLESLGGATALKDPKKGLLRALYGQLARPGMAISVCVMGRSPRKREKIAGERELLRVASRGGLASKADAVKSRTVYWASKGSQFACHCFGSNAELQTVATHPGPLLVADYIVHLRVIWLAVTAAHAEPWLSTCNVCWLWVCGVG